MKTITNHYLDKNAEKPAGSISHHCELFNGEFSYFVFLSSLKAPILLVLSFLVVMVCFDECVRMPANAMFAWAYGLLSYLLRM